MSTDKTFQDDFDVLTDWSCLPTNANVALLSLGGLESSVVTADLIPRLSDGTWSKWVIDSQGDPYIPGTETNLTRGLQDTNKSINTWAARNKCINTWATRNKCTNTWATRSEQVYYYVSYKKQTSVLTRELQKKWKKWTSVLIRELQKTDKCVNTWATRNKQVYQHVTYKKQTSVLSRELQEANKSINTWATRNRQVY